MTKKTTNRVISLVGDNNFLKEEELSSLLDSLSSGGALEQSEFDGKSANIRDILDELRTYPFLNPQRVVVVRNAQGLLPAAEEPLLRYLENPADFSTLILDFVSLDRRTSFAKKLTKIGNEKRFEQLKEYELSSWLQRRARESYEKKLSRTDAEFIVEMVGNNLGLLSSELDKIASLSPGSKTIKIEDIESIITRGRSRTIFMLTEKVESKQCPQALNLLDEILSCGIYDERSGKTTTENAGIAPFLLHMLNWSIDRLWQANRMLSRNTGEDEICSSLKIFNRRRRSFFEKLKYLWPESECRRCHGELLKTDRLLKSSGSDNIAALLETLVTNLSMKSKVQDTGAR